MAQQSTKVNKVLEDTITTTGTGTGEFRIDTSGTSTLGTYQYTYMPTTGGAVNLEEKVLEACEEVANIHERLAKIEMSLKHLIPHLLEKIDNIKQS